MIKKLLFMVIIVFLIPTIVHGEKVSNCNSGMAIGASKRITNATNVQINGTGTLSNIDVEYRDGISSGNQIQSFSGNRSLNTSVSGSWADFRGVVITCNSDAVIETIVVNGEEIYNYNTHFTPPPPPPTIEGIVVKPSSVSLEVGEETFFTAEAIYSNGAKLDVTFLADWSISDPEGAEFYGSSTSRLNIWITEVLASYGIQVKALTATSNTITATHDGMTGIAILSVSPPPSLKDKIRAFIDKIFNPFHSFLDLAIENLQKLGIVTAQGLNVGQYLSIFGDMPSEWQLVISSLLLSLVLIGSIFIFRSIMRLYFSLKDGVKWW